MSLGYSFIQDYGDHLDSLEQVYDVALKASRELPEDYIFIETGTRAGGSALAIMQAIHDSGKNRWFFTIDPYGMKPYKQADEIVTLDYGEDHYRTAMRALSNHAYHYKLLHSHFRMKSLDWMRSFDQSEFWYDGKIMEPKFGFAYLDGDHDSDTVTKEYEWLKGHTPDIAVIVDDAHYLNGEVQSWGNVMNDRLFIGADDGRRDTPPETVSNIQD